MSEGKPVIIDTNILFSALLSSGSKFIEELLKPEYSFFICELALVELFKHKERIVRLSQLPEDDVVKFYYTLVKRLNIFKEDLITEEQWFEARGLCKDIDETPHIALTLELNGLLWTGDKKLKDGLKEKGFNKFFELNE